MGFCMGGMQALKAAASGRFDEAVAFYGMIRVPRDWVGPPAREPLDAIADVCPTLVIFGGVDPWTPPADVEALRAAWAHRTDARSSCIPTPTTASSTPRAPRAPRRRRRRRLAPRARLPRTARRGPPAHGGRRPSAARNPRRATGVEGAAPAA